MELEAKVVDVDSVLEIKIDSFEALKHTEDHVTNQINERQDSSTGCVSNVPSSLRDSKTFAHRTYDLILVLWSHLLKILV